MRGYAGDIAIKVEASESREKNAIFALYVTPNEAEEAVRELHKSGFDMQKLSIVGMDYQTDGEVVGYYTSSDRMKAWGKTGAFWGGLWGLLFGPAFFFVPDIGPLLAGGPVVGWIAGALEGAAVFGGVSALGAGLYSVGIPKRSAIEYETQIRAGKFVVIAHGSPDEVGRTTSTLAVTRHQGIKEYVCCRQATLQEIRTGDRNPAQPMIGEKTWRNTYF